MCLMIQIETKPLDKSTISTFWNELSPSDRQISATKTAETDTITI